MDRTHYDEMTASLDALIREKALQNKRVYLFGHCHATETLASMLSSRGFTAAAILDNNEAKQGRTFCGIPVMPPQDILLEPPGRTVVCIAARAFAAMFDQLRRMGYRGPVHRLVNYNSFAEYSLSEDTVNRMRARMERGRVLLQETEQKFPNHFRVLCPFPALGDVYLMMSYLPAFLRKRGVEHCVVGVVGNACAHVVRLFDPYAVRTFSQTEMDGMIQAALFTGDSGTFIAHQDRPYVVNLHCALYRNCISLERMYCCGVFGLPADTKPVQPLHWVHPASWQDVPRGNAVLIAPYAKSVPALPDAVWSQIVNDYTGRGLQCFTNVAGDEPPLAGTKPLRLPINQLRPFVEWAGTFTGIRSGICDVLRGARCRKIALYPDYNYCDTKWKAIDMYYLDGWDNLVVCEDFLWNLI